MEPQLVLASEDNLLGSKACLGALFIDWYSIEDESKIRPPLGHTISSRFLSVVHTPRGASPSTALGGSHHPTFTIELNLTQQFRRQYLCLFGQVQQGCRGSTPEKAERMPGKNKVVKVKSGVSLKSVNTLITLGFTVILVSGGK